MSDPTPDAVAAQLYEELRALAGHYQRQRPHDTFQPTALVHEAWLRLANWRGLWESEAHFRAVAAKAMRQILVDRARRRLSDKRGGGGMHRTTLSGLADEDNRPIDVLDLEEALGALEALDPLGAQIVELRYLGGLSVTETAEVLAMSRSAVQASWRVSRAFLEARLTS